MRYAKRIQQIILTFFPLVYPYIFLILLAMGLMSLSKLYVFKTNEFRPPAKTEIPLIPTAEGRPAEGIPPQIPVERAMEKLVEEYRRAHPEDVADYLQKRSELLYRQKMVEPLIATYEKMVEMKPASPETKKKLADLYVAAGKIALARSDIPKARQYFTAALNQDPTHVEASRQIENLITP